jgi:hypothetical protein
VIAATREAGWLLEADAAAVWVLRDLAESVDVLRHATDLDTLELRGALAGRLLRGADALGLTPAGRARIQIDASSPGPDLATILAFTDADAGAA